MILSYARIPNVFYSFYLYFLMYVTLEKSRQKTFYCKLCIKENIKLTNKLLYFAYGFLSESFLLI